MGSQDPGKDPTPEEIRMGIRAIQSGWTEKDERQRRTGTSDVKPYTFRRYADSVLVGKRNVS